jgi:DNA-binding CsgD family transcriptional regulator
MVSPTDRTHGEFRGEPMGGPWTEPWFAEGLTAVLDHLDHGVILVDRDATVLFANAAALECLAAGSALSVSGGRLKAQTSTATTILKNIILRCASGAGGIKERESVVHCRVGDPPVFVLAARAEGSRPGMTPGSIVTLFITDPARTYVPSAEHLRQQFGLTRTESLLAVDILSGEGLGASARRLGVSVETARTHLRHIFTKTGARRQAELVRLLFSARHPVRPFRSRADLTSPLQDQ